MPELGLFPLAIALLPTERVPLHIFEPRYQELIGLCLAEDREFGLLLSDDDGTREIGTRARIVEVLHRFDDGRLNVVVEGGDRFRVVTATEGESYLTAEVEPVADDEDPPGDRDVERALELFRALAEQAEADVEEPDPASDRLAFELAARVDFGPVPKQELLELGSESARLRRVSELLERAVEAVALARHVSDRAGANGKVGPPA